MNLNNLKFDSEYWNPILERLNKNIKQIFLIAKNIDIKVSLNRNIDLEGGACCVKTDSCKYEIFITKSLLEKINLYLIHEYNSSNSLLFKDIPLSNFDETCILIRDYILEFVALHEFAHIARNHLDINIENEENIIQDIDLLEVDADRFGSRLLSGKYLALIEKYGSEKNSYLIKNLMYAQFFIYEIRFRLENNKNLLYKIKRIALASSSFLEAKHRNSLIVSLSINEIQEMFDECIFYTFSKYNASYEEITKIISDQDKILKAYYSFRIKYDLERKWEKTLSGI